MVAIGVDVGGTTIAAGAVASDGRVLVEEQRPTHPAGAGAMATIVQLIDRVTQRAAAGGDRIAGIGVGVPGVIDPVTGRIGDEVPHVPELAGQRLGPLLAERFTVPVFVDNDVNALALAEWRFGEGRGARSVVVLAPGTGFGGGVVLDERLVRGAAGFGGEFGHAPVRFDGRPCWCGGRGCLAAYASGRGIAEAARERGLARAGSGLLAAVDGDPLRITAPMVFRAAADGEPDAAAVIDEACRALGAMIAIVINGLNPDVVVITGGVAAAFAKLERRVLAAAAQHAFARAIAGTRVIIVPGDKRVTMRGAAALVFYEIERSAGRTGAALSGAGDDVNAGAAGRRGSGGGD
jgi:glucokinase